MGTHDTAASAGSGASLARVERAGLAADLRRLGPDAPTILPGWDAIDLLVHLVQRESAPHLMALRAVPVSAVASRVQGADDALRALPFEELVDRFAGGPPRLSPMRPMDALANGVEYFIHHEDLLRAQPDWAPRHLPAAHEQEVMRRLHQGARLLVRTPVQVTLLSAEGSVRCGGRGGHGSVQVSGLPSELALWAFGRDEVAQVRLDGDPRALATLRSSARGF